MDWKQDEYQVIHLEQLSTGRCLIVLEDGTSFPLYKKELKQYDIEEEAYLTSEKLEILFRDILAKRAKLSAMHQLERMDRTEAQLIRKLKDQHYPDCVVQEAVSYVAHYHYIDDDRYARNYYEYQKEHKSLRQIEQDLLQKGISKEVFQNVVSEAEMPDEESQIRQILIKKQYDPEQADRKDQERIYRYLMRKGYNTSAIHHVLRIYT